MFWHIARKDIHLLMQDRRALVVLLVFPMIFITIIGLTTGKMLGWQNKNQMLTVAYSDQVDYESIESIYDDPELDERSRLQARNVVSKIVNSFQIREGVRLIREDDPQMLQRLKQGLKNDADEKAAMVMEFGPDFYADMMQLDASVFLGVEEGTPAEQLARMDITLSSDAEESSRHALIEQFVWDIVRAETAPYALCENGGQIRTRIRVRCEELEAELDQPPIERLPAEELEPEDSGASRIYDEIVPGFTVMFVFFLVNIMARSFLEERELGTLRRLRLAPVSPVHVLVGKTLPFFILSIIQTTLLFLFGRLLFNMSWGAQPLLILPILLATSLSATALGLMISTIVRSDSQVSAYATAFVILLASLSGCFLPRDWLSPEMQIVSLFTPHGWALIAYDNILTQSTADLGLVARCCGVLVLFSIGFFGVGIWKFRRFQ
ncbi:ABC transporter permease [Thalassoroseus pseudoceratinae]|uniref:ABC transporter permease n=1 Tax=Thalassoroseus pseudoceratinae TaxID=2713176 RepID=UPI00141EC432|nr:ABC transporter permease [Thalassoroseus pseudoceratinae]